ncbi:hypothetical protein [Streptosporangium sp. NPDC002721]|uniref:hypothetical protein n=1 Tax=Streptosporangium sp. NPDC002721 TaxID=3366188 RepID=UPI0036C47576
MKEARKRQGIAEVGDEAVVQAETRKATLARQEMAEAGLKVQRERAASSKAARRTIGETLQRLVTQDEAGREAARSLVAAREAASPDDSASSPHDLASPSERRHASWSSFDAMAGSEIVPGGETLVFTGQSYGYWDIGNTWGSLVYGHEPADEYALRVQSIDGEPDYAYGAYGFNLVLQAPTATTVEVRPFMRYEYQTRLEGPTSFWGDGEAWFRWGLEMGVWQDGNPVVGFSTTQIANGSISGGAPIESWDGGYAPSDLKVGFLMEAGRPYTVTIGAWANCDSWCSPGACGKVSVDMWLKLPLVFVDPV